MSSMSSKTYRAATGTVGDRGYHGVDLEKFEGRLAVQVSQAEKVGTRFSLNVSCDEDGANWVLFHAARVVGNSGEGKKWNAWIVLEDDELEDKLELLDWTDLLPALEPRAQSGEFEEVGETEFDLVEPIAGATATPATSIDVPIGDPVEIAPTDVVSEIGPSQPMTDEILQVLKRTREPSRASPPPLPAHDSAPTAAPVEVPPQILPGPALPSFQVPIKASVPAATPAKVRLPEMQITLFATPPLEAMKNGDKGITLRFKVENGLILVAIRDEGQDQSGEELYATFTVADKRHTTRSSFVLSKKASEKGYGEYTLRFVSEHDWECVANLFRDGGYGVTLSDEMKPDISAVSAAARAEVAPHVRGLFDGDKTEAVQRDGGKDEEMSEDVRPRLNGRAESSNPTITGRLPLRPTLVLVGEDGVELLLDPEKGEYTVGREDADVIVNDLCVSKKHAELVLDSETHIWYLQDMDSSNGTKINGSALDPGRVVRVEAGDELSFGGIKFMLVDAARRRPLPRSDTAVVERRSKKRQKPIEVRSSTRGDVEEVKEKLVWVVWAFRIFVGLVAAIAVWMKFGHDFISVAIASLAGVFPVATWLIDKMAKSSVGRKLAENLLDEDTKLWDLIPGWAKGVIAFIVVTTIVLGAAYLGDKYDIAKRLRGAPQITVVEDPKPVADPKPVQAVVQPPAQQPAATVAKTVTECLALQRRGEALTCCDGLTDPNQAAPCKQLAGSKPE